jgi:hypothetical protein
MGVVCSNDDDELILRIDVLIEESVAVVAYVSGLDFCPSLPKSLSDQLIKIGLLIDDFRTSPLDRFTDEVTLLFDETALIDVTGRGAVAALG